MKIFITGINGQLGYDIAKRLIQTTNYEIIGCGSNPINKTELDIKYIRLDIANRQEVIEIFNTINPDIVIHCAAWTNVDAAKENENKIKVFNTNAIGTFNLAEAAKQHNAKFVYFSTDYVFSGTGEVPWKPDSKDFNPLNLYGFTKWQGELFVSSLLEKYFIIRISWIFGINGKNFVKTMLKLSEKYQELKVVDDQIGLPTYTFDLAKLVCDMIHSESYGIYHATNTGDFISWYDFAKEIFEQSNIKCCVIPVSTEEYELDKKLAARPKNSRLDTSKLTENNFEQLPNWKDALGRYLNEISKKSK